MLVTCFGIAAITSTAVTKDVSETAAVPDTYSGITANPYDITDSNDNATILQCWNWSYANLEKELPKIAQQGFSVVQISPPNVIKEATKGHKVDGETNNGWWMFYQPAGFQLNEETDNALGTKTELIKMVKTAHSLGVRVIADSVINHMGTNGNEDLSIKDPIKHVTLKAKTYEPEIYNNNLFHNPYENMTYGYEWDGPQDTCTYDLTRRCTSKLPDLKTEDSRVQKAIYEYLQEMVDCGIDGFRFDAAKHIETPNDLAQYRSDFWKNTVTKVKNYAKSTYGKDVLSYGEILNTCGYGRSYQHYFPFMKVTDSTIYRQIQKAVNSGSASSAIPQNMANGTKAQTVLWDESHDTYMDGESKNFSKAQRNKTWAAIAARDGITSMYLARPANLSQQLGIASETDWTSKEVAEVNKFNNNYAGQGEYLSTSGSVAIIGRGSKTQQGGAVLINCSGTSKSVSGASIGTMADGTYTDRVAGGKFTVKSGKISGSIGNSGVAVVYEEPGPTVSATASGTYTSDTKTISLNCKNVDSATYSINGADAVKYESGKSLTLGTASDKVGATYVVTLKGYVKDKEEATATFTYTKVEQESEYKIVLDTNNVSGWTSRVNVYAWNSANESQVNAKWPGKQISGTEITLPNTYDRIIFNTGTTGTKQTVDLVLTGSAKFTIQSTTTTNSGGTACNNVKVESLAPQVETYYPGVETTPTETETQTQTVTDKPTETVTETDAPKFEVGDVDRNGTVNIKDATVIQKALVDIIVLDDEQQKLADFDGNGRVSIQDCTAIQKKIAGLS